MQLGLGLGLTHVQQAGGGGEDIPEWLEDFRAPSGDLPIVADFVGTDYWDGSAEAVIADLVTLAGSDTTLTVDGLSIPDTMSADPPPFAGTMRTRLLTLDFTIVIEYLIPAGDPDTRPMLVISEDPDVGAFFNINSQPSGETTSDAVTESYPGGSRFFGTGVDAPYDVTHKIAVTRNAAHIAGSHDGSGVVQGEGDPLEPWTAGLAWLGNIPADEGLPYFIRSVAVYVAQPDAHLPALSAVPVMAVIDFAGNEEITEYVNNGVVAVTDHISFTGCTALQTIGFSGLQTVGERISFADCALLTSVNLGALQSFGVDNDLNFNSSGVVDVALTALTQGGEINFQNCADLESVSCPALTTLAKQMGFQDSPVLETINFPILAEVGTNLSFNNNALLATIAFPALTTVGGSLSLGTLSGLTALDLSELVSIGSEPFVGGFSLTANSLEELSLPSLEITFNGINVNGTLLADVNISALLNCGSNVYFNNCSLSEASVDAILTKMASLDGTSGTTLFENLEVSVGGGTSAPPSATGLTKKATLEGRGCTVTVNE